MVSQFTHICLLIGKICCYVTEKSLKTVNIVKKIELILLKAPPLVGAVSVVMLPPMQ